MHCRVYGSGAPPLDQSDERERAAGQQLLRRGDVGRRGVDVGRALVAEDHPRLAPRDRACGGEGAERGVGAVRPRERGRDGRRHGRLELGFHADRVQVRVVRRDDALRRLAEERDRLAAVALEEEDDGRRWKKVAEMEDDRRRRKKPKH